MTPKLAVFDCDGVLVDSEGPVNEMLVEDLANHGLSVAPGDVPELFTGGTMGGVFQTARARGAALPEDWVARFYDKMFARLSEGVPLIPGVTAILDALEASGAQIWIASNGPMRKMRLTLGPSGLWHRFAGRILSREDFAPKPAPDMIRFAMAQAGVSPDRTVMIDDSETGCRAGLAAGVRTIGFAAERQHDRLASLGIEVARSMADVRTLLKL